MKKKICPYLFLMPSLTGVAVFALIPFVGVVKQSVYDSSGTVYTGAKNFTDVFQNQSFLLAVKNTICFLVVALPLCMVLSFFTSVLLMKFVRLGKVMQSIYVLPLAIPMAALVLFWNLLFDKRGILNGILCFFGQEDVLWLQSDYGFWILVLLFLWKNFGLSVMLWMIGMESVPAEQIEAARLEGAEGIRLFVRIVFPNIWGSVYTLVLLLFIHAFQIYRDSYMLAGDYPERGMYMLQNIMNNWFRNFELGKMAAAGILCALAIVIVMYPFSRKLGN